MVKYTNRVGECGYCGKPLEAYEQHKHHLVPRSIDPSRIKDKTNLIILCPKCHTLAHANSKFLNYLTEKYDTNN